MKHPGQIKEPEQPAPAKVDHSRQTARLALYARLVLGDALGVLIGFSLAGKVRDSAWLMSNGISLLFVVLPVLLILANNNRAYALEVLSDYAESARRAAGSLVQTFLFLFALLFAVQEGEDISRLGIATVFGAALVAMLLFRYLSFLWVRRVLGGAEQAERIRREGGWRGRGPSVVVTDLGIYHFDEHGEMFAINTVIGHTNVPLDRRSVLESRFNDLMGDILLRYSGADVAMTPGFRFDSVVAAPGAAVEDNTIASGAITLEDVYRFFPVPYTISTGEIQGDQFRKVMEEALTNVFSPDVFRQSGGWLEGFSGVDAKLSLANPDGNRVQSLRLKKNRQPLGSSKIKGVGCSRFMDPSGSLCSYPGFSNVRPLINPASGQPWTPVDLFVHALSHGVGRAGQGRNIRDTSGVPLWPRAPLIQPLRGAGR